MLSVSGKPLRIRACALLALSLLPLDLCGQQLPIRAYTASDGLPHYDVIDIVKDSHGFLWFCTPGGLSRFDGYQFTSYGTPEGLPSARVETLLETRAGDYWVGTAAGLCRFNPKSKGDARFTVYRPEDRSAWRALTIAEDGTGGLWVGTWNGLYRFQLPASERNSPKDRKQDGGIWHFVDVGLSLEHSDVSALAQDSAGVLWVGSPDGLYRRESNGHVDQYWREGGTARTNAARSKVTSLAVDRSGAVWVGTWGGLWRIPPGCGASRAQAVPGLPGKQVWSLIEASDGHVWAME
jgi:ligand-binding sensor domain-containing protein